MSDDRIDDLVSDLERHRQEHADNAAQRAAKKLADRQFDDAWRCAYSDLEHSFDDDVLIKASKRLILTGVAIKRRLWDFRLAELMQTPELKPSAEVCLIILRYACAGDEAKVLSCLQKGRKLLAAAHSVHQELFESLEDKERVEGLPFTPLLSQKEMAKVLGVTYDKFRGDVRAGRWMSMDEPSGKKLHRRKWKHAESDIQLAALVSIQEKFQEKIWSTSH